MSHFTNGSPHRLACTAVSCSIWMKRNTPLHGGLFRLPAFAFSVFAEQRTAPRSVCGLTCPQSGLVGAGGMGLGRWGAVGAALGRDSAGGGGQPTQDTRCAGGGDPPHTRLTGTVLAVSCDSGDCVRARVGLCVSVTACPPRKPDAAI